FQRVVNLSGGNQQKVALSKWLFTDPKVLILDEPTRGIDVGAQFEIYNTMNELAAQGHGGVMISPEMPERRGMRDRIYGTNEGRIAGELAQAEASQERIMALILQDGMKGRPHEHCRDGQTRKGKDRHRRPSGQPPARKRDDAGPG